MADWYVSSAAYSGYTAFATSHAYSIGDLIVPTAPANKAKWVFQCTVAGTSSTEPGWTAINNGTSTSGTATFKNITGQSSLFWTAAAGDLPTLITGTGLPRLAVGDRAFVSSDHSETQSTTTEYGGGSTSVAASFDVIQFLCVNRAGSTPPVAADLTTGATCTVSTGNLDLDARQSAYHYGIAYVLTSTGNIVIQVNVNCLQSMYLKNCRLYLNTSTSTSKVTIGSPCLLTLDNTTVQFANAAQLISNSLGQAFDITWINTPNAIPGGTLPTTLIALGGPAASYFITMRGVDISALTGTLFDQAGFRVGAKILLDSCKIASGLTRYRAASVINTRDEIELINCYDGTNTVSERYAANGTLTTETTITLSGGAQDDVGAYSHKMISNTNIDKFVYPFAGFWMDVNNTTTGVSTTATVEIISSTALNNDEIALYLEYEGTAGSSVTSFANSFITTALTTPVAVTTSTATWNSSPATPVKQKLQVTFTPQTAGRLRGQVRLGKASATVYVNPQITVG